MNNNDETAVNDEETYIQRRHQHRAIKVTLVALASLTFASVTSLAGIFTSILVTIYFLLLRGICPRYRREVFLDFVANQEGTIDLHQTGLCLRTVTL